ncbi:pecanex-like protein 2 [Striga asiatica]|uniref:Pecanex-like protein 2 n=1 Tax=Striga asiatica TaxID=4170 RepID=A0A5A7QHZ6_STRAF|nr:pecanex-like protein 2 [Striga asiatica]
MIASCRRSLSQSRSKRPAFAVGSVDDDKAVGFCGLVLSAHLAGVLAADGGAAMEMFRVKKRREEKKKKKKRPQFEVPMNSEQHITTQSIGEGNMKFGTSNYIRRIVVKPKDVSIWYGKLSGDGTNPNETPNMSRKMNLSISA